MAQRTAQRITTTKINLGDKLMGQAKRRKLLDPNYGKSKDKDLCFGKIFKLRDSLNIKALLTVEAQDKFVFFVPFVNPSTSDNYSGIVLYTKNFDTCMMLGFANKEVSKAQTSFTSMFECDLKKIKCQATDHIKKYFKAQVVIEYANF